MLFDTVVVCSVTGSTQAGMIAGFAGEERPRRVLGIDGSATVEQTRDQILRIARRTAEAIGLGRELRDEEIVLLDEWHAGTYGIPDARRSTRSGYAPARGRPHRSRLRGQVDGRADRSRPRGRIEPGSRVLYAHLGGQPALNAYAGAFA